MNTHAIPEWFNPLPAQDPEYHHEAVEEVGEVPSRYLTFREHTLLRAVVIPVQLHSHHGENEDDDADDEGEVGKPSDHASHDGQDVVQGLPILGELENSQKTQRSKH